MSIIRSAYIGLLATFATVTIAVAAGRRGTRYAYGPAQGLPDTKVGTSVASAAAPDASLSFLFWGAALFVLP